MNQNESWVKFDQSANSCTIEKNDKQKSTYITIVNNQNLHEDAGLLTTLLRKLCIQRFVY